MDDRKTHRKRAFFDWRYITVERRRSYTWACILFWSILMTFFVQRYVIGVGIVIDRSMLPTLQENSTYLINKYLYHFTRPKRGDIVVLRKFPFAPEPYVKRVIGLEGETIQIKNGEVYVNGERLNEPYAAGKTYPHFGPYTIKKGNYFVLGDNRFGSLDSRHFGTVPLDRIEGKIKPDEWFPFR